MDGLSNQYDPNHPIVKETINCLIKTFTEKDNQERTKAENILKELENDILSHLKNILAGFRLADNLSDDTKLSIVIYLKNTLKSKLVNKLFSKEDVIDITQSFLELILYTKVTDNLLQNLSLSLTNIFNSFYFTKDNELIGKVFLYLQNYTLNLQGSDFDKISKFKPMISIFQIVISSLATNKENVYDVIGKELEIVDSMIALIRSNLSQKENYALVVLCVESSRYVMDFLFLCVLKLKRMEILESCKEIFINKFIPFTLELINLDSCLIAFTGNNEYDSMVNSMKAKSFQFISFLLQNEGVIISNLLLEHLTRIIPPSISGLSTFVTEKLEYLSQMSKDSSEYPDSSFDILLFQIMLFLSRVLVRDPVLTQFTPLVKNFVLNVIFPFLISTKRELIKMQIDGEDYHNMMTDLTQNHKFKTYKTAASFLLTKLSEKYDGLGNFVVNLSLQLIDYSMKGGMIEELSNYPLLNYMDQNTQTSSEYCLSLQKILTTFSPENLIDVAMLNLLILSSQVNKSPSNMALLRIILETHIDKLFNINSQIIKDKLCLIYGTYMDELYQPEEVQAFYSHIFKVIEFLFMQIFLYKENQGVAYQAAYALNQLIYYKDYSDVVNGIVRKIMPRLIEIIKEIDVVLFFDVLVDIVVYLDIEDCLIPLCREVVNRILKEIKTPNTKTKDKSEKIFLNKSFHILRTVLEKNKLFTPSTGEGEVVVIPSGMEINEFESIIEPVVMYIKNPLKIDFDDEIIYLMISVLNNAQRLTKLSTSIFKYLSNYIAKNEGMTEELFEFLNLFIIYDHERWLSSSKESLQKMVALIKTSIEDGEEYENSPVYGSLLTQVLVQQYPSMPEGTVEDLFYFTVNQTDHIFDIHLDEDISEFLKSPDIYIFAASIIAIYSFFINYPLAILKIIESNSFEKLMKWTQIIYMLSFLTVNQSKIVIIGLCCIFSNPDIVNQLYSYKNNLLNVLFYLLTKQKNEESKNLKNIMKEETDCHFIDSDAEEGHSSDEEEDDDSKKVSHAIEYKKISKKIQQMNKNINEEFMKEDKEFVQITAKCKTPSKDVDEYNIFSRTIQQLFSLDNKFFDEWLTKLGEQERSMWNELIHTRRIKVEYSGNKIEVARRTLKIKRTPNQI